VKMLKVPELIGCDGCAAADGPMTVCVHMRYELNGCARSIFIEDTPEAKTEYARRRALMRLRG